MNTPGYQLQSNNSILMNNSTHSVIINENDNILELIGNNDQNLLVVTIKLIIFMLIIFIECIS